MKRLSCIFALSLFLSVTVPSAICWSSGEFWSDKPYTKWTEKEVKHLLSDSPWAKSVTLKHTVLKQTRREFGTLSGIAGEGEGVSEPEVDYTVYLRTARPIREGLVRLAQFEQKYDRLDPDSRKAFDSKWDQFLAAPVGDKVIVQVKYGSNTADQDRQLANFWQNQTVETIRDTAAMTGPDGVRLAPIAFWTARGAGREFQMAFPRPQNVKNDAALSVEFRHPSVTGEDTTRIFTKFQFKEMSYSGALAF
jgi:hypothetical protein